MNQVSRAKLIRQPYTLIELLTAMAILIVVLYVVTRLVYRVQTLTRDSRSQTEIYESAKVFFDVISQDLEGMMVSGETGREIYWTNGSLTGVTDARIAFVTSSGIGTTSADTDATIEVAYTYNSSDSTVVRWMTSMSDGTSEWDFYGNTSPRSDGFASSSWGDSVVVAENVSDFTVTVYSQYTSTAVSAPHDSTVTPGYVTVEIEVYDDRGEAQGATVTARSERKFTKNIFIYRGE